MRWRPVRHSEDVVDRSHIAGLSGPVPGWKRENIVPRLGVRLCEAGKDELATLIGKIVDLDVDLLLLRPFVTKLGQDGVGACHPIIPEANAGRANRVRGPGVRCNSCGGRRRRVSFKEAPAIE